MCLYKVLKGKTGYYNLGLIFRILAINPVGNNKTVLTELIAEISEHRL